MKNLKKKGVFEFEMKKAFNRALTCGNREGWFPFFNETDLDDITVCFDRQKVYGPITGSGLSSSIDDSRSYRFEELRGYIRG